MNADSSIGEALWAVLSTEARREVVEDEGVRREMSDAVRRPRTGVSLIPPLPPSLGLAAVAEVS